MELCAEGTPRQRGRSGDEGGTGQLPLTREGGHSVQARLPRQEPTGCASTVHRLGEAGSRSRTKSEGGDSNRRLSRGAEVERERRAAPRVHWPWRRPGALPEASPRGHVFFSSWAEPRGCGHRINGVELDADVVSPGRHDVGEFKSSKKGRENVTDNKEVNFFQVRGQKKRDKNVTEKRGAGRAGTGWSGRVPGNRQVS